MGLAPDRRAVIQQLADAWQIQGTVLPGGARLTGLLSGPTVAWYAGLIAADDKTVRSDLKSVVGMLERIHAWISTGVLGGASRNAADFQAWGAYES